MDLRVRGGEFLVIYDAEDRPEPDQLKKVVLAYRAIDRQPPKRGPHMVGLSASIILAASWVPVPVAGVGIW